MRIRWCANGLASGCGRRTRPPGGKRMAGSTNICAIRRRKARRRPSPTSPRSIRRSRMAAAPAGISRRWARCIRRAFAGGATNFMQSKSSARSEAIWRRFRGSSTNRSISQSRHWVRKDRAHVFAVAAFLLSIYGRPAEALPALRAALSLAGAAGNWINASIGASNLSESELLLGDIAGAIGSAARSVQYADQSDNDFRTVTARARHAAALHAAGRHDEAQALFADAERRQREQQPELPAALFTPGLSLATCCLSAASGRGSASARRKCSQGRQSDGSCLISRYMNSALGAPHWDWP